MSRSSSKSDGTERQESDRSTLSSKPLKEGDLDEDNEERLCKITPVPCHGKLAPIIQPIGCFAQPVSTLQNSTDYNSTNSENMSRNNEHNRDFNKSKKDNLNQSRKWFGFGKSDKADNDDEEKEEPVSKYKRIKSIVQEQCQGGDMRNMMDLPQPMIKGRLLDVKKYIDRADGDFPESSPVWSLPKVQIALTFVNKRGEQENKTVGPNLKAMNEVMACSIVNQFSRLNLHMVHHYAMLGEYMHILFRSKLLIDVLVHTKDSIFYAHRAVLACHSGYFAGVLLENGIPPYTVTDFTLHGVESESFKQFLHFAYTGDVFATNDNVLQLKSLANQLKSETFKNRLLAYLGTRAPISVKESVNYLTTTKDSDMKPVAIEVLTVRFPQILADLDQLGCISFADLFDILTADHLMVKNELDVFWAVLFWVATNAKYRMIYLDQLMSCVRFTTMTSLELMDCARVSEMVRLSERCRDMILSANWISHVRETGLDDPFGLPTHYPRDNIALGNEHTPTIEEFDTNYLNYKKLMERQSDEDITFYKFLAPKYSEKNVFRNTKSSKGKKHVVVVPGETEQPPTLLEQSQQAGKEEGSEAGESEATASEGDENASSSPGPRNLTNNEVPIGDETQTSEPGQHSQDLTHSHGGESQVSANSHGEENQMSAKSNSDPLSLWEGSVDIQTQSKLLSPTSVTKQ